MPAGAVTDIAVTCSANTYTVGGVVSGLTLPGLVLLDNSGDPTSVPINLLNPRPGTKFGDRELLDPWEVVKWIAIFRLLLPEALFRLCGGRVENLGDLQAMAVKVALYQ